VPHLLVIGGHDPSGGAGVDADLRAAEHFGAQATTVVTADTDQDGRAVFAIRPRAPEAWLREARDVGPIDAIKVGMLPGASHVRALVRLVQERPGVPIVVDPVLAASDGTEFLDAEGQEALRRELLPLGVVLTPNVPEAARLTGVAAEALEALDARLAAALSLVELGASVVVLKGGHGAEDPVQDLVLVAGQEPRWLAHPRVPGGSLHGSGCRFASALAAGAAAGLGWGAAAGRAGAWLGTLIGGAPEEGHVPGP
jgi:hydroxymethylpyrimidine/phosphomethylpyrimidine kinase